LAADASFAATSLRFTAGGTTYHADERRSAWAVSYERRLSERWTFAGSAGYVVDGSLRIGGQQFDLQPGPLFAASMSYRALDESRARPFVLCSFSFAASVAATSERATRDNQALASYDARLGVVVGKTVANDLHPYLAARVFGGPIVWNYAGQGATGTDVYHYQAAAGLTLAVGRVDVHLELAPLGERELSAGAGVAF
jgi:hypothetical protein